MIKMNENEKRPFPDEDGVFDSLETLAFKKVFYDATDEILDGDEIYDDRELEFRRELKD